MTHRSVFEALDPYARSHPVVVVTGDAVVAGGVGFIIGAIGYGSGSLLQGYVFAAILGVVGLAAGLTSVKRAHRPLDSALTRNSLVPHDPVQQTAPGPHSPTPSQSTSKAGDILPAASPAVTGNYWWARFREQRSLRVVVGGAFVIPALLLAYLHLNVPALVLMAPGGFIMSSAKYKRW